jgi:hypothetical protein
MQPESSLPHWKEPATCPNLRRIDPAHAPPHFFKIHINIILPIYAQIFQKYRNNLQILGTRMMT